MTERILFFGENMTSNQTQYTIRKADTQEIEAIRRMHAQAWRDTYQNDEIGITKEWLAKETESWLSPEKLKVSYEKLSNVFADPTQLHRIALRDDEIVGFVHFSTREDGEKRLDALYTVKDTYGTGLAQLLMKEGEAFTANHEVELEVVSYNERAKAFYRKYGFEETDKHNELFRDKIPCTTMIRTPSIKLKGAK